MAIESDPSLAGEIQQDHEVLEAAYLDERELLLLAIGLDYKTNSEVVSLRIEMNRTEMAEHQSETGHWDPVAYLYSLQPLSMLNRYYLKTRGDRILTALGESILARNQ